MFLEQQKHGPILFQDIYHRKYLHYLRAKSFNLYESFLISDLYSSMKISSATYVLLVLIDDVNYGPQNLFSKKLVRFIAIIIRYRIIFLMQISGMVICQAVQLS